MSITARDTNRNAGEWAELYVLLRTLADGKLYAADGDLNKNANQFFPIIRIEMQKETDKTPISYEVNQSEKLIFVVDDKGSKTPISMEKFKSEATQFFQIISTRKPEKNGKKLVFSVPEIFPFLKKLQNPETKKGSDKKADIHMVIHDVMTGYEPKVGFSIKSKYSTPATLINASGNTVFQYRITHPTKTIDKDELKQCLSPNILGPKKRIQNLYEKGYSLEFFRVKGKTFSENLCIIDSNMDIILAESLKIFMCSKGGSLKGILQNLSEQNPCKYEADNTRRLLDYYTYKLKRLVTDSALGMLPGEPWNGHYDASGGYIIIKEDGDVVCYHLYSWNALQDYLLNNLRFETPVSTGTGTKKSFNYALYYELNDEPMVNICMQIRFI